MPEKKETGVSEFRIPVSIFSMNRAYAPNHRRKLVYLTNEARSFKTTVKLYTPPWHIPPTAVLQASFSFYDDWYFKNGNMRKVDLQNGLKILLDAIAEKQGWDDCQIWSLFAYKHQDGVQFIDVRLEVVNGKTK